MKIYWNHPSYSNLGMIARPRGGDWLLQDIKDIKRQGTSVLISLLEAHEEIELGLEKEQTICEKLGIEFRRYPIEDRGIPSDKLQYIQLVNYISNQLSQRNKVVIHCRMGIGRTSLVCAGVLMNSGINKQFVFDILSKVRTLETPDTQAQKDWLYESGI